MTLTTTTLAASATAVVVVGSFASLLLAGVDFAAGVAVSGALMLVNLALWKVAVGRMIAGALGQGGTVWTVLIIGFKYAFLMVGLFALVRIYDGGAVLLGCSAVVVAVLGLAVIALVRELILPSPLDGDDGATQEGC